MDCGFYESLLLTVLLCEHPLPDIDLLTNRKNDISTELHGTSRRAKHVVTNPETNRFMDAIVVFDDPWI